MSRLSDITNLAIATLLGYRTISKAGLAIGTTTSGINTTGTLSFLNNGVLLTKAALTSQSIVPTVGLNYTAPAGTTFYVSLGLDALGNVGVVQGSYAGQMLSQNPALGVGISQVGASFVGDGSMPDVPAGFTIFGIVKIVNATNPFILGTTLLGAAGVTATYFDVAVLPAGKL